jgi:UDP-GlcNAc:undecaprenyl-phosphate/decaprenyl-phosphate GlcNAc-1-phosphate transferase
LHQVYYAFLAALLITFAITPLVKRWALQLGIVDNPGDKRKIHKEPVPYLGGLAIYLGFCASVLYFLGTDDPQVAGILFGATGLMLLGVADDKANIPAIVKLLGQLAIISVAVVYFDIRIWWLTNPFNGMIYLNGLSIPLTIIWIVAVVNTLNLIDGLDGLAAGVSSIAAATLLLLAWRAGQIQVAVLTAALIGSSLGFLRYNFNPARIFMGDSGSMLLGFVLASVSVEGALKSAATIALIVPILALGLPLFDTFFAVIRRLRSGRPIYEADRNHLHHRLMDLGLSQRRVVMLLYGISALLGICAIIITSLDGYWPLVLLCTLVFLIYLGARKVNLFSIRHEK